MCIGYRICNNFICVLSKKTKVTCKIVIDRVSFDYYYFKRYHFMKELTEYINHTLLKPETNHEQIEQLDQEAIQYKFKSVCVHPYSVPYCSKLLQGETPKVCTVIGFPLGASTSRVKAFEAKQAIVDGADEVDMVINIGELKANRDEFVK